MGSPHTRRIITDRDVAQLVEQVPTPQTKLDVAKMVILRMRHNKTHDEIAEIIGCTRETVSKALGKFIKFVEDPGELAAYRENKPDFYEGVELKIMSLLNERLADPTSKPSIKDLANALKVMVEMRRLETGQSTDNVAVFVKSIENAHKNLFVDAAEVKELPPKDEHVS